MIALSWSNAKVVLFTILFWAAQVVLHRPPTLASNVPIGKDAEKEEQIVPLVGKGRMKGMP